MKTVPKISILVNVVLLICLLFIMNGRRMASPSVMASVVEVKPQATAVNPSAQPVIVNTELEPFRWSQLEAVDYRTYIKNLRGIGCPEPTIQAIVAADVRNHYNVKYQELQQKLTELNHAPLSERLASYKEQQTLEAEIQKLPGEEASMAANFLAQDSQSAATQIASRTADAVKAPILPLVFQNVDLSKLDLNQDQIQKIADLRNQFVDEIGGPNQNPSDPAYLQRWQLTQPEIDNILKGYLGINKYMEYQVMLANE